MADLSSVWQIEHWKCSTEEPCANWMCRLRALGWTSLPHTSHLSFPPTRKSYSCGLLHAGRSCATPSGGSLDTVQSYGSCHTGGRRIEQQLMPPHFHEHPWHVALIPFCGATCHSTCTEHGPLEWILFRYSLFRSLGYIFTHSTLVVLYRVRVLEILLTILTLVRLGRSMNVLDMSGQTVSMEDFVTKGALDSSLLVWSYGTPVSSYT